MMVWCVCARIRRGWTNARRRRARSRPDGGDAGRRRQRDARERDDRRGASDWYGVAYGAHPRTLLYADRSTVKFVDLRTRRGNRGRRTTRGRSFRAVSRAREHYYALASATTTTASLTTSFVEIRDARRARDPVVRWEHQGFRTPTTLRVVDRRRSGAERRRRGRRRVYDFRLHARRRRGVPVRLRDVRERTSRSLGGTDMRDIVRLERETADGVGACGFDSVSTRRDAAVCFGSTTTVRGNRRTSSTPPSLRRRRR